MLHNALDAEPGIRELTKQDFEAMALGVWVLGTGGGGDPYMKLLNMQQLMDEGHKVTLLDPMYLDDEDFVGVLSSIGAPLVGQERLADPDFAAKPFRMMEEFTGKKFRAVMPVEIGGANGMHPFLVSAVNGIPVVDADAMGRAYPEGQMTSFAIGRLKMFPVSIADIRDNEVILTRAESWKWTEKIARSIINEFGAAGTICDAPRTGAEVKKHGIKYTVSKAIRLGEVILNARAAHEDPVEAVIKEADGMLLFKGKIIDVNRKTSGGFLRGIAVIEGIDQDKGKRFTLHFQNEFSVGYIEDKPVVMTPDLICVLDSVSGAGLGSDTIRFGQRISIVILPAPSVFLSKFGLESVGPRAFGFDLDYKSVFPNTVIEEGE